jgi:transcription antitermination protein NusB
MAPSPRHRARELVLQGLYAQEIGEIPPEEVVDKVIVDDDLSKETLDYARLLYEKVRLNSTWADAAITRLATNWDLNRIAVVDRIILRLAMTEIKEEPDVPVKVVLNEAIELAKSFSTAESSSFINGVLDSFAKNSDQFIDV